MFDLLCSTAPVVIAVAGVVAEATTSAPGSVALPLTGGAAWATIAYLLYTQRIVPGSLYVSQVDRADKWERAAYITKSHMEGVVGHARSAVDLARATSEAAARQIVEDRDRLTREHERAIRETRSRYEREADALRRQNIYCSDCPSAPKRVG